jgi:hypothetical protein
VFVLPKLSGIAESVDFFGAFFLSLSLLKECTELELRKKCLISALGEDTEWL